MNHYFSSKNVESDDDLNIKNVKFNIIKVKLESYNNDSLTNAVLCDADSTCGTSENYVTRKTPKKYENQIQEDSELKGECKLISNFL